MHSETLDFEEPIVVLLKEIQALSLLPRTAERQREIEQLRVRVKTVRREIYAHLTPWQRVLVARHPNRPNTLDLRRTALHGVHRAPRRPALWRRPCHRGRVCVSRWEPPCSWWVIRRGVDTKQKIFRNFGYTRPEGYRKALRTMKCAEKFGRPIIVFVDTPAAYPGIESEERGVAEAIAYNLREMAMLAVPVVVLIIGEGGSGGALGVAVGDRVLIQEFAIYSVIPPEGCAAILWRDVSHKVEAAGALKLTAPDLLAMRVVDEVVPEPCGGAHMDHEVAATLLGGPLRRALAEISSDAPDIRIAKRYDKFRQMGNMGLTTARPGTLASAPGSPAS